MSTASVSFRLSAALDATRASLGPKRPDAGTLASRAAECEHLAGRHDTPPALRAPLLQLAASLVLCAAHRASGEGWAPSQGRAVRAWCAAGDVMRREGR